MSYRLSLDDMFKSFPHFSQTRKLAIAFAVYTQMSITEVIHLKWSDTVTLNWRAELILSKLEASTLTEYIFWEVVNGKAESLLALPLMVNASIGWSSWDCFVKRYQCAIPIEFSRAYLPVC
jgi:hypothetical protein